MKGISNDILLEKIDLVMNRLVNLGGGDYERDSHGEHDVLSSGLIERDFGIEEWDWPQGVGLMGLVKLQNHFGDSRYDDFLTGWFSRNFKAGLPSRNVNTTAPFLTLLDLAHRTGNKEWMDQCSIQAEWLARELPKTVEGGFQHVTSAIGDRNGIILNEGQIWVDTLFMAVLFLNRYSQITGRTDLFSECIHQFLVHIKYLCDRHSGLFYHGWSFDRMDNFGSIFWCRGNSWFTLGSVEFLDQCTSLSIDDGVKRYITDAYKAQVEALSRLQSGSGLWHTVLTDPTSYEEASGTAGIAAGILRGLKAGILGEEYLPVAQKAIRALIENIDSDGNVLNVSAGTGIGMDAGFYKKIVIRPMAYGQALALIALAEALE